LTPEGEKRAASRILVTCSLLTSLLRKARVDLLVLSASLTFIGSPSEINLIVSHETDPLAQTIDLSEYLFQHLFFHMSQLVYIHVIVRWLVSIKHGNLVSETELHQIVVGLDNLLVARLVENLFFQQDIDSL
jgi:hypothetical protein